MRKGAGGRRRDRWAWLRPDFVVDAVVHLTPQDIARLAPGTRAVCLDIDGTITDYHAPFVPARAAERLASYTEAGLLTFIISNCYDDRVDEVHRLFDPLVTRVFTPADCVDPGRPGDKASKHRKPAPDMLLAVARSGAPGGGELAASGLLMVGDQLLKDVLAARRAGAASVLVLREGSHDHPGVRVLQRPVEWVLRVLMGLPVGKRAWPSALTRTIPSA